MAISRTKTWVAAEVLTAADLNAEFDAIVNVLLTNAGHNVAAAVHGLPASVNVLGNRDAAGEFIQRGNVGASGTTGADQTVHLVSVSVTFAVAHAATPRVFVGAAGGAGNQLGFAFSLSTTGFTCMAVTFGGTGSYAANVFAFLTIGT